MRYTVAEKTHVRELRVQGFSLNEIQSKTSIPKTTIRLWASDINLTEQQKQILQERALNALQNGRKRSQIAQNKKRSANAKKLFIQGKKEVGSLTSREIFITGIALYWAEGFKNKYEHRLGFCNSDPFMITFYLKWLHESLGVKKEDVVARLTINSQYKEHTHDIEQYWSEITHIPLNQFTKAFYQNTQWRKQYSDNNYHGVLRIHVKKSLDKLLKMKGWLDGFKLLDS